MLKNLMFFTYFIIGIVFATEIIDVNGSNTIFKMEQVNAEVLNVNIMTGDVLALSTMTNEGEFIRLSLPGYHASLDEREPELPEIHNLIEIPQNAGNYALDWDASSNPSDMYFLRMETSNEILHQKLMLIK